jgi:hypothetical protein
MHNIAFQKAHRYDAKSHGISLPIELANGTNRVRFDTKLDTGAEFCLFKREYGEMLGLAIESGERRTLSTLTGTLVAYGHEVSLRVLGLDFELVAYFYESPDFRRSVLGRTGWLPTTRLGIVDYDQMLYLSRYDDSSHFPATEKASSTFPAISPNMP